MGADGRTEIVEPSKKEEVMSDVITMLKEDHREVEQMAGELDSAATTEEKKKVARRVIRELAVHAAVEEVLVYPALRVKVKETGDRWADHSIEEHHRVKELLDQAEGEMEKFPENSRFVLTITEAINVTRKHNEEEEGEVFPALERNLDKERLEQMGRLAQKIKPLMPTHPHPLVPGAASAQLLAGPLVSIADHVRDLLGKLKDHH
jgi:hemerythrin superfamily protein